jgi:zinc protease
MSGQARTLGYFEMMRGGFEKAQDYLRRFQALGAAQVAEAAKLNLTPQNLSVVIQVPEGAPVFNQEELVKAAQELTPRQIAAPPKDAEKARRQVLANGLVLITQPRRAVPLVAMTLAAPGGQANESGGQAGLYNLWSRTLTRGSQNRTYEQLTRELEDMAGSLSAFSGKSTCGLSGDFLASDYKRGLELLAQTWLTPSFSPAQIKKAKAEQMAALRRQQDSPVSRTFLAFRPLFYGDHPYGHNPLGSPQKVASFTREDLLAAHRRVMGPGGAVLTVVGDINPEEVKLQVERLFGAHKGKVDPARPGPVPPPAAPRNQAITDPKAKQTQIVLGYPGPSATDPGRHALNLISAMLGGMGGRLFSDLRDQRSLAYAVQPFYSSSKDAGVLGVYMAVGPGKVNEAVAGLNQHLDRLRRQPPASGELERAKAYVLGGLAIGLQSYSAQASIMAADELLGLGYDYYLKLPQDIKVVTNDQILKAAKLVLNPSHRVKLTLGP